MKSVCVCVCKTARIFFKLLRCLNTSYFRVVGIVAFYRCHF